MRANIKKDYVWNTAGVFLQNALSPILLIVIARVNGLYDVGLFSFAFALAVIFWAIGLWGGRTYQVSDVKNEFSQASYILARFFTVLLMLVLAGGFILINHYDAEKSSIVLLMVLFKATESIADVFYGVMQSEEKLFLAGRSLVCKTVLGLGAFIGIDLFTRSIAWSSIALIVVNVLVIVLYDRAVLSTMGHAQALRSSGIAHYKTALAILKRCGIIFVISLLAMLSLNIPRYFLDKLQPQELGYFGIMAMPVTLIVLLVSFIIQPHIRELATLYRAEKQKELHAHSMRILGVTFLVGMIILVGTALFGAPLLRLIFGIDFSERLPALLIMVLGAIFNAAVSVYIQLLIIARSMRTQLAVLFGTTTTLAIGSYTIIASSGLLGATLLFAGTSFVQLCLLTVLYRYVITRRAQ